MPINNPNVVYPELRLVTFDSSGKVVPAISISGDYIARSEVNSQGQLKTLLTPLIDLLITHIKLREDGGDRWNIADNQNNHPALEVARQLLNLCLQGRSNYRVIAMDDTKVPGRKYLLFQVDKPVT